MMRRLLTLAIGAAVLTVAAGSGSAFAQGSSSAARSPAATTLSQCLQTHDRLSVLVLVDQSGSLDKTDRENLRVGGLGAALLGLKRLSERLGSRIAVEVLVAGFYYEVVTYPTGQRPPSWTELNDRSIKGLLDEVGRFADLDRHKGRDTDYAAALIRSRDLFRARTKELDDGAHGPPCKALVWFTDGNYEVQDRLASDPRSAGLPRTTQYAPEIPLTRRNGGDAAERRGRALLCADGGIMDDLVRDEIVKFTVGLSDRRKAFDTAFLRGLTTGTGGCGSQLSQQTGQYFDATNNDDLLFVLSGINGPRSRQRPPASVCPQDPCRAGLAELRLVDGLGRFIITADTGSRGIEVVLVDPKRGEVRLRPGDPIRRTHSGAQLTQWWISPRQVVIEGVLPPGDPSWQGTWHLAFVHPPGKPAAVARYSVQLIADLVPKLDGKPHLTRGETAKVAFRLVRRDGGDGSTNPLSAAARVTATVTDANGQTGPAVTPSGPDDGRYTAEVRVPDTTAQTADFDVHVDFEDRSDIAPIVQSFPVRVNLPESYPAISPDHLELDSISGNATTSGTVTITGSERSGGCAWIAPPDTRSPKDAGDVAFSVTPAATSAGSCLQVQPGEAKQLRVTFDPASAAAGSVQSKLPVHLRSEAVEKEETTTVPVSFELYPTGIGTTIRRTIGLMLLGTLLPLLILHILNLVAARFPPEHRVKFLAQDVTYAPGPTLVTARRRTPPETEYGKFEWLSLESGSRKRSLDVDVLELHTVASGSWTDRRFRLFAGPYGVATSGDRLIVAGSSVPLRELRGGRAHEVPLGLAGTWLFVVMDIHYDDDPLAATPSLRRVDGRLVLLIAADGDIDQGAQLEREARTSLAAYHWPPAELAPDEPAPPSGLDRLRGRMPGRAREEEPAGASWLDASDNPAMTAHDDFGGWPQATAIDDSDGPAGLRF